MPTLLTLLEIPGIQIALAIGAFQMSAAAKANPDDTSQTARLWTAQGRPLGVSHQTTAVFG